LDGDRRDDILTAGFAGIDLYRLGKNGKWSRTKCKGRSAAWPKGGSERYRGLEKADKCDFFAAIEPWHGNKSGLYANHRQGNGTCSMKTLGGRPYALTGISMATGATKSWRISGKGGACTFIGSSDSKAGNGPHDAGRWRNGASGVTVADLNGDGNRRRVYTVGNGELEVV